MACWVAIHTGLNYNLVYVRGDHHRKCFELGLFSVAAKSALHGLLLDFYTCGYDL